MGRFGRQQGGVVDFALSSQCEPVSKMSTQNWSLKNQTLPTDAQVFNCPINIFPHS